jgi:hypothetical protein
MLREREQNTQKMVLRTDAFPIWSVMHCFWKLAVGVSTSRGKNRYVSCAVKYGLIEFKNVLIEESSECLTKHCKT